MIELLSSFFSNYVPFSTEELKREHFILEHRSKKDFLLKEGSYSNDFFLILNGYVRTFHITDEGEEITTDILRSGEMASSMYSILKHEPAYENIQCLTDCQICRLSEKSFEELCSKDARWFILGIKFLKNVALRKEERIVDFAKLKAHERYTKIIHERPDIIQNVPGQYIASYIGVKPESLSRIRNHDMIS